MSHLESSPFFFSGINFILLKKDIFTKIFLPIPYSLFFINLIIFSFHVFIFNKYKMEAENKFSVSFVYYYVIS